MAQESKIEWTDVTWNPIRGCTRVSEGCRHCYAERMAARFGGPGKPYEGLAVFTPAGPRWTNEVRVIEAALQQPLRWRKPRNVFVNSMSDLFHEQVTDDDIRLIFDVTNRAGWHVFQVLTKRSARLAAAAATLPWTSNIWMGVSVESGDHLDRIDHLRTTCAAVKFLSLEPLLGQLCGLDLTNIDWVIVGGESGPGARPMSADWVRDIRDQCIRAGVPFFFKQWGGVNKKKAGRVLDGRIWDEMPRRTSLPYNARSSPRSI